jgi:enterochelin esterase family protein
VTFRYAAKGATHVELAMDKLPRPLTMVVGTDGVWTATTAPLLPEVYNYSFVVDGNHVPDPHNPEVHAGYSQLESLVTVPGKTSMPWELQDVPHGELSLHRFTTHVAQNLPANQSTYVVYTPAGYDAKRKGGYPVLYLLHGYTDGAEAWTQVGRAHFVLDAMISSGKAVPMIVVMPLGYGDWKFLTNGFSAWNDEATVDANVALFSKSIETEVMPAVEREYNCAEGRENRAVSGLSMGGLETLDLGLRHPEQFAYVAAMSAAVQQENFEGHWGASDAKAASYKLLWVGVGTGDRLLQPNRDFVAWAKGKGYKVEAVETTGSHQWPVWRENLVAVLPLLFR